MDGQHELRASFERLTIPWHDGLMSEPVVLTERVDSVGIVRLNRPAARNAINRELRELLPSLLGELDADPSVSAMVLTGSDPAFCAGLDLKDLATAGFEADRVVNTLPFESLRKPLIGAVNGPAVTGGLEYALGCDFLIASPQARFADTHARVGVMPGWGLTVLLPQAIGRRRAHQMSFTGNYINADTALTWGLVNEVVPHDRLIARAVELASTMAEVPLASLIAIKEAYRRANAGVDEPAVAAERAFSRSWARDFDREALAASREGIQERGRSQAPS